MKSISVVTDRNDFTLDLLVKLRQEKLSSKYGAPDELLLHSGGPQSDLAQRSLLMGPANCRYIVRQQPVESEQRVGSALRGEIDIQAHPTPLQIHIEDWDEGWHSREIITGSNLADGLRQLSKTLLPSIEDGFQAGGFAGLLTYDMVQHTEPLRLQHTPADESILMILYRADRWIIHNHLDASISIQSAIIDDQWVAEVESILNSGISPRGPPSPPRARIPETESDAEHAEKVRITQAAIREGVLYQLNYGRKWSAEIESPWDVFDRLERDNPAPLSSWLHSPDLQLAIASSSPELLLKQDGKTVSTRPIKGTRPRGDDSEHDANLRGELVGSRKEIAEHLMLVDLERNDLGRICLPGSVHWKRWRIESYPHVQHMVSEVEGTLNENMDGFDALQSVFPGGSITGCPKSATIAAIDELEATPRHAWTGSIGHIDPRTGQSQWNILIRTLEAKFDGEAWQATVQAGGGLVIGSNPWQEVEEAKWKAQAICRAAWDHSPAGATIHSPRGTSSLNIHPIPPVTAAVQHLLASRNSSLIPLSPPDVPDPIVWYPGLSLAPTTGKRVLFVDNLDSFSWNIVHAFATIGAEVIIVPGRLEIDESTSLLESLNPTHIVLGPGPGRPEQSVLTMALAHAALIGQTPPILGVCLGHQAIGLAAGWTLTQTEYGAVHGVPDGILTGTHYHVMTRYHSLALKPTNNCLDVTSTDAATNQIVMALTHPELPIFGVQYHPESAGSANGTSIFEDFLGQ
ncbi:MAG: chorismate-binding protein [Candidatus Thalassarchaeaceae archaeon]|nr:chorismate-binding protein [Candidatus Thalassarchaeaceae archaeon]